MVTKQELEKWSDKLKPIITDINIAITNMRIISIEHKRGNKKTKEGFVKYLWHQQRFILFIQLSKLFSNNNYTQKHNYNRLLNRLFKEELDNDIKLLLTENSRKITDVLMSREQILQTIKLIKKEWENYKSIMKEINILRNKVYAHTDPESQIDTTNLESLEKITLFATGIYQDIIGRVFDIHISFEDTKNWDIRAIFNPN